MIAKTESDIKNLRLAGKYLAEALAATARAVKAGVTTAELDMVAEREIRARGGVPAFLNYKPRGAAYAYPAALCISVNDEVVHGIPSEEHTLEDGDIVSLDLGLSYNGLFSDSAITVIVGGECDDAAKNLLEGTREALRQAIKVIKAGAHVGDVGAAVELVAKKYKLGIVEELGGHALGKTVHEKPFIPNMGHKGNGEKLVAGLVLAIEPIMTEGSPDVGVADDEWTYLTLDHSRAAHFEQSLLVTEDGCEILTPFL